MFTNLAIEWGHHIVCFVDEINGSFGFVSKQGTTLTKSPDKNMKKQHLILRKFAREPQRAGYLKW